MVIDLAPCEYLLLSRRAQITPAKPAAHPPLGKSLVVVSGGGNMVPVVTLVSYGGKIMAKTALTFNQEYAEKCPDCAAVGIVAPLGLVLGVGIVCAEGEHFFEQLPDTLTVLEPSTGDAQDGGKIDTTSPATPATFDAEPASVSVREETAKPPAADDVLTLQMWEPIRVTGGGAVVLVEIPEAYYLGLLSEAEGQRQTFGQYLKDWMTRAAENAWY